MRPPLRLTLDEFVALATPAPDLDIDSLAASFGRGDGHTVLAMPGIGRGDGQTEQARRALARLGYDARAWELGINTGPTHRLIDGAARRLETLAARGAPVSLIGFSMGGLFARLLAHRHPALIRQVITVCSPIQDAARAFWLPVDRVLGFWPGPDLRALAQEVARPLPVPLTALYSKEDGLVHWQACLDPARPDDCIEVRGRHVLAARNGQVMRIIAERLAQPVRT